MSNPYYFGVLAVLVFWVMSYWHTKRPEPWALAISEGNGNNNADKKKSEGNGKKNGDKKRVLSASKFQALLWTLIVLFSYSSIFGARFLDSHFEVLQSLPEIPLNLFLLMAFSVTTTAGSKSITISYKTQGRISQKSGGLISNPQGQGDLQKTQMLAWTIMGGFIYLMSVIAYISTKSYSQLDAYGLQVIATLPDVDSTLLLLMGVSQGSYLGNKVVNKEIGKIPKIVAISPTSGPNTSVVTITGENFGIQQGENYVVMHETKIKSDNPNIVWTDNEIRVKILSTFDPKDELELSVFRDNILSNKEKFTVT